MPEPVYFGPKILVGIDGSANAAAALRWAVEEARDRQATVEAVYVYEIPGLACSVPGYVPPDPHEIDKLGQTILDEALSTIDPDDIKVYLRVVQATPVDALIRVADEPDVTLVAVGARGHGGVVGLLLGSVSHTLTHRCPKPLVVVPAEWSPSANRHKIVVGVDGSPESARALAWGVEEARACGSLVEAIMVWPTPSPGLMAHLPLRAIEETGRLDKVEALIMKVVDAVNTDGVSVETRVVAGQPAQTLIERSEDARLLVVGARGIGRAHEMVSGSVSHSCTHRAVVPVVVVPPIH